MCFVVRVVEVIVDIKNTCQGQAASMFMILIYVVFAVIAFVFALLVSKDLPGPISKYVYDTKIVIYSIDITVFVLFYVVGIKRPAWADQQVYL